MKRDAINDCYCAIARAAGQLTDAWSFVILREIFFGNLRYDGIRLQTGMSPRALALRLASLVRKGILEKVPYQKAPVRHEYRLTEKGFGLWPVMMTMTQWGARWAGPWDPEGPPARMEHRERGHDLEIVLMCKECGERVEPGSIHMHMSDAMKQDREDMARRSAVRSKKKV